MAKSNNKNIKITITRLYGTTAISKVTNHNSADGVPACAHGSCMASKIVKNTGFCNGEVRILVE